MSSPLLGYQYTTLRCVPRVDREEFLNVGVVLYCQAAELLASASRVEPTRLAALAPELDVEAVIAALSMVEGVCTGDPAAGAAAQAPLGTRFGFLTAPRSTVLQPGPVHGGMSSDPAGELERLLAVLVG